VGSHVGLFYVRLDASLCQGGQVIISNMSLDNKSEFLLHTGHFSLRERPYLFVGTKLCLPS
jgi:hypothetical protein